MLRFFALLLLVALVGSGVYLWHANPHKPPKTLGDVKEQLKDGALNAAVKTALSLHDGLKPYPISIATENGVVTLGGQLPREELRAAAEGRAAAVPEVTRVVNQIKLGGAAAPPPDEAVLRTVGEKLDDEGLEVQARMALSLNRHLRGARLEVTAWKKEVRLSGEVKSAELRAQALETVREITGVKRVTDAVSVSGDPAKTATDERREAVLRAVRGNTNLGGDIDVRLDGDKPILVGHVRNGAERDLAGLLARDAVGRAVQNQLEIRP